MAVFLRVLRGAMAVATIVALIVTFVDGTDEPGFNAVNFFSYFTVLSNIGAITVLGALFLRPDLLADRRFVNYRGAVTLYMAITGVVYNVLLAPAAANVGVDQEWTNSVVHVIGPIVIVVDWFLDRAPLRSTVVETASCDLINRRPSVARSPCGWRLPSPAAWTTIHLRAEAGPETDRRPAGSSPIRMPSGRARRANLDLVGRVCR